MASYGPGWGREGRNKAAAVPDPMPQGQTQIVGTDTLNVTPVIQQANTADLDAIVQGMRGAVSALQGAGGLAQQVKNKQKSRLEGLKGQLRITGKGEGKSAAVAFKTGELDPRDEDGNIVPGADGRTNEDKFIGRLDVAAGKSTRAVEQVAGEMALEMASERMSPKMSPEEQEAFADSFVAEVKPEIQAWYGRLQEQTRDSVMQSIQAQLLEGDAEALRSIGVRGTSMAGYWKMLEADPIFKGLSRDRLSTGFLDAAEAAILRGGEEPEMLKRAQKLLEAIPDEVLPVKQAQLESDLRQAQIDGAVRQATDGFHVMAANAIGAETEVGIKYINDIAQNAASIQAMGGEGNKAFIDSLRTWNQAEVLDPGGSTLSDREAMIAGVLNQRNPDGTLTLQHGTTRAALTQFAYTELEETENRLAKERDDKNSVILQTAEDLAINVKSGATVEYNGQQYDNINDLEQAIALANPELSGQVKDKIGKVRTREAIVQRTRTEQGQWLNAARSTETDFVNRIWYESESDTKYLKTPQQLDDIQVAINTAWTEEKIDDAARARLMAEISNARSAMTFLADPRMLAIESGITNKFWTEAGGARYGPEGDWGPTAGATDPNAALAIPELVAKARKAHNQWVRNNWQLKQTDPAAYDQKYIDFTAELQAGYDAAAMKIGKKYKIAPTPVKQDYSQ